MTRATQISRVVFGLLVLATFFAFFAAQRLKHTDPLVYSVSFKRYISPNDDGLREKGRVRFRIKKSDYVTVTVIDRTGSPVRVLADEERLSAGPHTYYWNGRYRGTVDHNGHKHRGQPVPDGAYRVRITLRGNGRTFVPDQFFVVDTEAPKITANVVGSHTVSILRGRSPVKVNFSGAGTSLRAEFLVYRVRGQRTSSDPVASFLSTRRSSSGAWDQTVGAFSGWDNTAESPHCYGTRHSGRARPAPTGSYVIVARACDAAGNVGSSSDADPPRSGSTRGLSGVTLTGVQIAPPTRAAVVGTRASFRVAPPSGGYRWRIASVSGSSVASGTARGGTLHLTVPDTSSGLYVLRIQAKRRVAGDSGVARAPLPIASGHRSRLLIVQPAIAWQATNPVDMSGDGFPDPYQSLPAGETLRVPLNRLLARAAGTTGFGEAEGALAQYLETAQPTLKAQYTTDIALAANPAAALRGHDAVLLAGDERWLPAALGTQLRRFVEGGGKVAFFSLSAFRRTVTLSATELAGPSEQRGRDIFGESTANVTEAPAPVAKFKDELGLLRGPTGLFTLFQQSKGLASGAQVLTSGGREPDAPAFVGYKLGKGEVIRVGAGGWLAQLGDPAQSNVAWSTNAILEVLK
ncbi:MAG: hypothetical protein QM648_05065 [Solirubrobacterales bacterium]